MKQETFFGVRKDSEKHLYVRRGDNNEVLITKTVNGESITEENTVHLNAEEARKLGIQLLKLGSEELPKSGIDLKNRIFRGQNHGIQRNKPGRNTGQPRSYHH